MAEEESGGREAAMPELRTIGDRSSPGRAQVVRGRTVVATIGTGGHGVDHPVDVVVHENLLDRDEARHLLGAARDAAGPAGTVLLDTRDLMLRYEARAAGLTGGLRQPLAGRIAEAGIRVPPVTSASQWERLGAEVGVLVPAAAVSARPARGVARRAMSGFAAMIDLAVALPDGAPLLVFCPDVADVVPEVLALAIDTIAQVRGRLPIAARAIAKVSFDHSYRGLRVSKYAGMAHRNLALVRLNGSFASADGLVTMARRRREAPAKRPPAPVPAPATAVDATTAHEAWHQIEAVYEARAYRSTIGFRRALGEPFGVATLEHAVLGGSPGAPPGWRAAHERLVAEVSPYAGTSTHEATAEMFKLWWCSAEPSWSPAVRQFDLALAALTGN